MNFKYTYYLFCGNIYRTYHAHYDWYDPSKGKWVVGTHVSWDERKKVFDTKYGSLDVIKKEEVMLRTL